MSMRCAFRHTIKSMINASAMIAVVVPETSKYPVSYLVTQPHSLSYAIQILPKKNCRNNSPLYKEHAPVLSQIVSHTRQA